MASKKDPIEMLAKSTAEPDVVLVTAMSEALVSKDVYEICAMVERVTDYLGIGILQLTRNLSSDAFCLVMKETDLRAHTDRTMAARGSLNRLPLELQAYLCEHLNDAKFDFPELKVKPLTPRPVSFSIYSDSSGVIRVSQIDSNLLALHDRVAYFVSSFSAPVYADAAVTFAKLSRTLETAKTSVEDHEAKAMLNEFDLVESKFILSELEDAHPDLKLRVEEKSDIVQSLSASLTDSAQTRSSPDEGTDAQNSLTEQFQVANGELTEATAAVAANTAIIKKTKNDNAEYKKTCRANLVGITPLKYAVKNAKLALNNHQELQGKSHSVHVPLKDRGYGQKSSNLRNHLVVHITTTREMRAENFMHGTAIQPTIGLDMLSDQLVEHLAHLVAFDRCWAAIVDAAANLPSNDDVSTCKLMRNEFLGEEYYNKSNVKD